MRVTARSTDAVVTPMDIERSKPTVSRNRNDGADASAGVFDSGTDPFATAVAAGARREGRDSWKRIGRNVAVIGWMRLARRSRQQKYDANWRCTMRALSRQWKFYSSRLCCSVTLVSRQCQQIVLRNLLSSESRRHVNLHRYLNFVQDLFTMPWIQYEGRRVQCVRITGARTLARRTDGLQR